MKKDILTIPILFTILLLPVQWVHAEWTITIVPNPNPQQSTTLCKIDFIDPTEGWALDCSGNVLLYDSNGTWTIDQRPDADPYQVDPTIESSSEIEFTPRD